MILSCRRTAHLAAAVFLFFVCSLLVLPIDNAAAGYGPAVNNTQDGGGSWGAILEMSVEVNGPYARFMIRKKDALPFNSESDVFIRTGSWRGETVKSGTVRPGSRTVELRVRLNMLKRDQPLYACMSNSYGHAWVGPVRILAQGGYYPRDPEPVEQILGYVQETSPYPEPEKYPAGQGLGRPLVSEHPRAARLDRSIDIPVTAGICRQGGYVRVQCVASGSDWNYSNPYDSGWVRPGQEMNVPFRFHDLGWQTISCRTLDSCCASAWTGRSIEIMKKKVRPSVNKSANRTETKINISVVTDADGRSKSKVKVESSKTESCAPFCDDSEITFDRPYLPEYRPAAPEAIYPGNPYNDSQL
ncbi:hypothetical protein GCAAIG_12055 [Candidatus Electronema halotolerans]